MAVCLHNNFFGQVNLQGSYRDWYILVNMGIIFCTINQTVSQQSNFYIAKERFSKYISLWTILLKSKTIVPRAEPVMENDASG